MPTQTAEEAWRKWRYAHSQYQGRSNFIKQAFMAAWAARQAMDVGLIEHSKVGQGLWRVHLAAVIRES